MIEKEHGIEGGDTIQELKRIGWHTVNSAGELPKSATALSSLTRNSSYLDK